jgi:two-component system, chemotaxis family, chemotaxis protein CheY
MAREKLRILVVDDQDSMRQLVCTNLRGLGITQVHSAEDGAKALAHLRARDHDLVLLDAEMPRMNGIETLTAIRGDEQLRGLKVIMVTGRADADFVRRLAELGIEGYLVKPVSTATLAARIDAVMRKSS